MTARYRERLTRLEAVLLLENLDIDMQELRASCSYGVPDGLRPLCWRLLLGLLPTERHTWQSFLKHQRDVYEELVQQVIVRPGTQPSPNNDHPLSESEGSEWGAYFEDNTVLRQIDKDCRRLCPEIEFFQRCTPYPNPMAAEINLSSRISMDNLPSEEVRVDKFGLSSITRKRASQEYQNAIAKGAETHWQVLERILFIYSKLNPGVKYVQGMNEVIGPIYYVFASDPDREWAAFAEPDTFYCFQLLMSEIKDNFIKTLDTSDCGIEFVMTRFHDLLKKYDPPLHEHLVQELSIKPQFYAFRWLSLLLSQEFPLPDVITVWDSLFSDSKRFDLLQYVGLAMLESQRDSLLGGDFSHCLRLLQNYPEGDVGQLVMLAMAIREGKVKLPGEEPDDDKTNRFANMLSSTFRSFIKK